MNQGHKWVQTRSTDHGVIFTLNALVPLGHADAVAVLVALALHGAVVSHPAKEALTDVGLDAHPVNTALVAHGLTPTAGTNKDRSVSKEHTSC